MISQPDSDPWAEAAGELHTITPPDGSRPAAWALPRVALLSLWGDSARESTRV